MSAVDLSTPTPPNDPSSGPVVPRLWWTAGRGHRLLHAFLPRPLPDDSYSRRSSLCGSVLPAERFSRRDPSLPRCLQCERAVQSPNAWRIVLQKWGISPDVVRDYEWGFDL